MKRAVASRKSQGTKFRSIKGSKQTTKSGKAKSGKILKLKIPKKRQISIKRALLAGLFITLIIWALYPLKQLAQQRRETRLLQARIVELKTKNSDLENEIKRLNSDEYIEQLARRYFGLVRAGESSVLVVPPKEGQSPAARSQPEAQAQPKKENPETKKEMESSKIESGPTDKSAKEQDDSNVSWWQKILNFLDKLTGRGNR